MRAPLRKIAILAGFATDIGGTMISTWAVIVVAVMIRSIQSREANTTAIMSAWASDRTYIITLMGIGMVWTIAGGFVAGKIAGREAVRHALWTGVASTVIGLLFTELRDGGAGITWLTIAGTMLTIPCAVIGGYLARATSPQPPLRGSALPKGSPS